MTRRFQVDALLVQIEWIADLAAGGLALLVYLATLAPTITWLNSGADSGDLVTAAFTLGIPHPPGYPLYTLIAAAFSHLPFGEPARNVSLFSALAAACSVILISRSARALLAPQALGWTTLPVVHQRKSAGSAQDSRKQASPARAGRHEFRVAALIPPSAALVFAFAPLFWSQSTIPEIYAFNLLIVSALLVALLSESRRRLFFAALAFGLGLAHHLTIVLMAPAAVILLAATRWKRGEVMLASSVLLAPLLFYLYLPWRAAAQPPVSWGDPRTIGGFWWTVTGASYHSYLFDLPPSDLLGRIALAVQSLFDQFKAWGIAAGLWGIAQMASSLDRTVRRRLVALTLGFLLASAYAVVYVTRNSLVYLLPAFVVFTLWMAYGLGDLANRIPVRWRTAALGGALVFMPAFNLFSNYSAMDVSHDRAAYNYAQTVFAAVPRDAVLLTDGDEHLFALWYYRYVAARDSAVVVVSSELLQYDWYYDEVRQWLPYARPNVIGQLAEPDRARAFEIVNRSLENNRAVYTTAPRDWLARYSYQPRGDLFWILKQQR